MLYCLSKCVTKGDELKNLAVMGLELELHAVSRHLNNRRDDITMAALDVLLEWRNSQENSTMAYIQLCKALRRARLNYLVGRVLESSGDESED